MKIHFVLCSLFMVLLSVGCKNPAAPGASPSPAKPGYGTISVLLSDTPKAAGRTGTLSRTLFPPLVFDRYTYTFTKWGDIAGANKTPDSGGYFTLAVGTYTVEVKAYVSDTLVASGVSEPFTVSPGDNAPVTVYLSPVAAGLGEFSYTITYPEAATVDIALYQWPLMADMGLAPSHVCDDNGVTEWLELAAGTYLLTVQVSTGERYAGLSEAIHIYPGLATEYEKVFVDDDFIQLPTPVSQIKFVYFWIDQHDNLITSSGNTVHQTVFTAAPGETIAIAAQGTGYTVREWHINGVPAEQSGEVFYFSSENAGKHTVGLFVEKNGRLYNSNIVITVGSAAEKTTHTVIINMFDSLGDGWNGGGALRINVNGINIANDVKVAVSSNQNTPAGQRNTNTFSFAVTSGDAVKLYWVLGSNQVQNSFIAYYEDAPPVPAFTLHNDTWVGANALIFKLRSTMSALTDGALLGSFTAE